MTAPKVRIGLGVITHRRPAGLQRLLQSFARLQVPEGVECIILIAENDDVARIDPVIAAVRNQVPFDITYRLETERGIPLARNRVLDMAVEADCNFLTFVDDDQIVHEEWLKALYREVDTRNLDLCGGPNIYKSDPDAQLSWQNMLVLDYTIEVMRRTYAVRVKKIGTPLERRINIYTNNWMLRLSRQHELGVRFDTSYRYTGGSDTKFYTDFRDAGAVTGWAPDAKVFEMWTPDRLTFGYFFARSRDQYATTLVRTGKQPSLPSAIVRLIRNGLYSVRLFASAPFNGGKSIPPAMRLLGRAVGALRAARGTKSSHYVPDD